MKSNYISFWYLHHNHLQDYKQKVLRDLKKNENKFQNFGDPEIIVDLYNMDKLHQKEVTDHLFISTLNKDLISMCEYILSKDRFYLPVSVSCESKKDYSVLDTILKKNFGEKSKLSNCLFGIGFFINIKSIHVPKNKPTPLEKIEEFSKSFGNSFSLN